MLRRTQLAFYNIRHAAETDEIYLYNRLALSLRCNVAVGTACEGSSTLVRTSDVSNAHYRCEIMDHAHVCVNHATFT